MRAHLAGPAVRSDRGGSLIIEDEDWQQCFGTDTSEIEKPATAAKPKLNRSQHQAGLILSRPELFSGNSNQSERKGAKNE